jgi:hypothetical protein
MRVQLYLRPKHVHVRQREIHVCSVLVSRLAPLGLGRILFSKKESGFWRFWSSYNFKFSSSSLLGVRHIVHVRLIGASTSGVSLGVCYSCRVDDEASVSRRKCCCSPLWCFSCWIGRQRRISRSISQDLSPQSSWMLG